MSQSYDLGNYEFTSYNIQRVRQPEDQSDIFLHWLLEKQSDRMISEESKADINKQVELLFRMKQAALMSTPIMYLLTPKGELGYPTKEVVDSWPFKSKFDLSITERMTNDDFITKFGPVGIFGY